MRRTRRLLFGLIALFGLLGFWLVGTNSGLRFVLARTLSADRGIVVGSVQGSLWSGVQADGVVVRNRLVLIEVGHAEVEAAIPALLRGALQLRRVEVEGLKIDLLDAVERPEGKDSAPVELPAIGIDALRVRNADVTRGGQHWHIDQAVAQVAMAGRTFAFTQARINGPAVRVDGNLNLDLARTLMVRDADLRFDLAQGGQAWRGVLRATSPRTGTQLVLTLQQPLQAELQLSDVRSLNDWRGRLQLPTQQWQAHAIAATVQGHAVAGAIALSGSGQYDALRIAAIDGHARVEDGGVQIAASTVDLTEPVGRVAVSGRIPFAADAPWTLALQTAALRFDSVDAPALNVSGQLAVGGSRSAPELEPALQLMREGWPAAAISGRVVRAGEDWQADALLLQSAESRLLVNGVLALGPERNSELTMQLSRFDPALLFPEWPGAVDAELVWRGALVDGAPFGEFRIDRVAGTLRERALSGGGRLGINGSDIAASDLALVIGTTRIELRRIDAQSPLQIDLQSPDLADLMPDWRGRLALTAHGHTSWRAHAEAEALSIAGLTLDKGTATATLGEGEQALLNLTAQLSGLSYRAQQFDDVRVNVEGTRAAHRVDVELRSGARQMQASLNGALDDASAWRGTLQSFGVETPEGRAALREPAAFAYADGRLTLARACLEDAADGRICVDFEQLAGGGRVAVEMVALDLQPLFSVLTPDARLMLQARVSANADAEWRDGQLLTANARVDSAEGALLVAERPDLDLGFRDLAIEASLSGDGGSWRASTALRPEGRAESSGQFTKVDQQWQYDGRLSLNLKRFDLVEAFTSEFAAPRGDLSGELQFRGRGSERPQWSGALAVTDFATELPDLGLELRDGALAIAAVPTGIIVRGAIKSGGGQLVLDGGRSADDGARWHFALSGENAVLSDTPALRLVLSPKLTLEQRANDWLLGGRVDIPEARVDAAALVPPAATSNDVVIVDDVGGAPEDSIGPWAADVTVAFGKQAVLIGYGFDGRVRGELRVRQRRGDSAYGQGQLQVSGKYAAYGQRLTIRRGRLLFANSPLAEPILDIEAERKAGSAVAGVRVTGSALRPQTEIYSRPAMAQSEALALIVTGRNVRSASGADRARLSSAALALGTIGGDLLASNLGAEIGVTGDAARGTEAFTIGKYVTPKLFIGYGIGLARRGQVFILRYLIREDVELEATSGEQSRASLNYVIER